jgi:hypothetical protein
MASQAMPYSSTPSRSGSRPVSGVFNSAVVPVHEIDEPDIVATASDPPMLRSESNVSTSFASNKRNVANPVWLHGSISKDVAEGLLSGKGDGTFLVRRRPNPSEFVLSLVYQGVPTHHLIAPNDSGILTINKSQYANVSTVHQLMDTLRLPRSDWPQRLVDFVPTDLASPNDIEVEVRFAQQLTRAITRESGLHAALKAGEKIGESQPDRQKHMMQEVCTLIKF